MTKILIVGSGVAGLSAAFELISSGVADKEITIIDKRTSFTREQEIFLNPVLTQASFQLAKLADYGYKLVRSDDGNVEEDYDDTTAAYNECFDVQDPETLVENALPPNSKHVLDFLREVSRNHGLTTIKTLQESLVKSIDIKLQEAAAANTLEVKMGYKIIDVTIGESNTAILQNTQASGETPVSCKFDHIIVADGTNSETLQLLKSKGVTLPETKFLSNTDNEAYGTAIFHYEVNEGTDAKKLSTLYDQDLAHAAYKHACHEKRSIWQKDTAPSIYLTINPADNTIYIIGQIPESFLGMEGPVQKMSTGIWFANILTRYLAHEVSPLSLKSCSAFIHPKEYYSSAVFKLGEGHGYIAGDALMPSLFLLGHGVEKAVCNGVAIAQSINANESDDTLSEMVDYDVLNYEVAKNNHNAFKYNTLNQVLLGLIYQIEESMLGERSLQFPDELNEAEPYMLEGLGHASHYSGE